MTRVALAICVAVCMAPFAAAENLRDAIHNSTGIPETARYEIIELSILAKLTLKVDRFKGMVFQLVENPKQEYSWENDVSELSIK